MVTRNISQFNASVNKLKKDTIKHTGVEPIFENGKQVLVSSEHQAVVDLASELRSLAAKILSDERKYADEETIKLLLKDRSKLVEYVTSQKKDDDANVEDQLTVQSEVQSTVQSEDSSQNQAEY